MNLISRFIIFAFQLEVTEINSLAVKDRGSIQMGSGGIIWSEAVLRSQTIA